MFLTVIVLMIIASLVHIIAKRLSLPYTILLFLTGLLLIPLTVYFPFLGFLNTFQLTPELLFVVFLPVLIFESGYNIKHQHLAKNSRTIRALATFGLCLATAIIGYGTHLVSHVLGTPIPLAVTLLFGIIISATDPVAVLSIFKKMGTPHRLNLLFEGESLFNDGTAVAMFLIMLSLLQQETVTTGDAFQGILTLFVMIFGGIVLGITAGIIFSKLIQKIKNNEVVEITLTMVLAHVTFILAESVSHYVVIAGRNMQISGVIATAFAAIIMGNYGKTKISPRVEAYMDKFWNFFAFLANSLVFLLMGLMVKDIQIPLQDLRIPLSIGIGMIIIGRAISIYVPMGLMNHRKIHEKVPLSWQHLMAWGSLRGALGLVLVLLIPDSFSLDVWTYSYSIKDFLLAMVIGAIMFSLLVKGLTMRHLIQKLKLDEFHDIEHFERLELAIMVYQRIIEKISLMKDDYHICKRNYDQLREKYIAKHDEAVLEMQVYLQQHPQAEKLLKKALSLHALGIEKQYLTEMFEYNECSEPIYMHLLGKIERQILRVEKGDSQLTPEEQKQAQQKCMPRLEKLIRYLNGKTNKDTDLYVIARTKFIITSKVLESLGTLSSMDFGYDTKHLQLIQSLYQQFSDVAQEKMKKLSQEKPFLINEVNKVLLNKGLMKTEERIVKDFRKKEMITCKLYQHFMNEVETEILRDISIKNCSTYKN